MDQLKEVDKEYENYKISDLEFPVGLNSFFGKNEFPKDLKMFRAMVNEN